MATCVAGVLLFALWGVAGAALVVEISTSETPAVGSPSVVLIETYAPDSSERDYRGNRVEVPSDYPWRVTARGPGDSVIPIPLEQCSDPRYWIGEVTFTAAGTWQIQIENFYTTVPAAGKSGRIDPRTGAQKTVEARHGGSNENGLACPGDAGALAKATMVIAAGGGTVLLLILAIRSSRRRGMESRRRSSAPEPLRHPVPSRSSTTQTGP